MKKTVAIVACLALAAAAFVSCSKSGASAKDESPAFTPIGRSVKNKSAAIPMPLLRAFLRKRKPLLL